MRRALVACLLLTGCGFGQGEVFYQCPGISYFGSLATEVPMDCKAIESNVQLAASMLVESGAVPYGALHDFNRVDVRIVDASAIDGQRQIGRYDSLTEKIYLAQDGRALLHEMLHHWEWIHGVLNTNDHPDWCAKGFGQFYDCAGSLDQRFHVVAISITKLP